VTQDDRLAVLCVWNALVVFLSVFFLTGAFFKSAFIAAFVLISCLLGFGQRWLLRGGFAVSVLAIAVLVGAIPHPDQWKDLFRDVRAFLEQRNNVVSSSAAAPDVPPFFGGVASNDQPTNQDGSRRQ
jgi:hypothetical protein